jgi:hypothetical protein
MGAKRDRNLNKWSKRGAVALILLHHSTQKEVCGSCVVNHFKPLQCFVLLEQDRLARSLAVSRSVDSVQQPQQHGTRTTTTTTASRCTGRRLPCDAGGGE